MEDLKKNHLIFFVNGAKIVDEYIDPEWTLLYYLRKKLRLCGTKLGCGEGGCGACTVMVSKYNREKNKITHLPVNACLAPVCSMHGLAVTTVEGIGSIKTQLHPVQERIAKAHGSQCGFCTPGMVMTMYTLLKNMEKPSMKDLEVAFQGNLCRCTGYRPIIEAYKTFTLEETLEKTQFTNGCGLGNKCCKLNATMDNDEKLYKPNEFVSYISDQEFIFPPELKLYNLDTEFLHFKGENIAWFRPTNLQELLKLKTIHPNAKIIVGNTEVGVEVKFKHQIYHILIQPVLINEMNVWNRHEKGLKFGAAMTLDQIDQVLKEQIKTQPGHKTKIFLAIIDMLQCFAGKQIRSVASVGGNIITGSPVSDLSPIFMAAGIILELQSKNSKRLVKMDENFYTGYRKNILSETEILISIDIPYTEENQYFFSHKQSRRKDDDIAIVNSAINITFQPYSNIIKDINLAFGGMAPTTTLATKTRAQLKGVQWNEDMLNSVYLLLLEDLPLSSDAPGGMIEYRKLLPMSFFFRTFISLSNILSKTIPNYKIDSKNLSAINKLSKNTPKSSQFFEVVPNTQTKYDSVGKPIVHVSALKQATGEAVYIDDTPHYENELHLAFVFSKKSYANVISLDSSEARKLKGVVGFISAQDLEENRNRVAQLDEELFITKTVTSQHQLLGAILAKDQATAQKAARMVDVKYQELHPIIVTIEDAIKHNSFFPIKREIEVGDVSKALKECKNVLEGECRTGYQEHFYFETHGCLVVPKDEDEIEIFSSTQHHANIAQQISRVLNIPQNKIVAKVKRIGGGFGGKETRGAPIAIAAAVAAKKFGVPVRVILERDEDMAMTGGRHPFLMKYTVAFTDEGKIKAYDITLFENAGCSYDESVYVLERAIAHVDNTYNIPNIRITGRICKTNLPSNTAFRGFGGPQAMFAAENMIRDIAEFLNKDPVTICKLNVYQEGDVFFYKQPVVNCNITKCIDECLLTSKYYQRKKEIEEYNALNRWKKRGISVVCTKYGIGFGRPLLNQAGALVLVYTDGSVLLSHGGVEMGQGLHTKMIQVASRALGVAVDKIHINESATDKVPNSSPTAASVGSDINGMAVLEACNTIKERLKTVINKNPQGTWKEWVQAAYFERISLSATGFYRIPHLNFDWEKMCGNLYNYYTFGAACTEVEIDCLTGDHQLIRTDIVMDLGKSLNPAIDIGQIEGAFMQGYGLFVMEEMIHSPTGTIYSKGPGAYKIPSFGDIPNEFNVSLLKGASNPRAVYSSKAVGEPPLFLASSALFAIRDAIKYARCDAGVKTSFRLNAPATAEKIRMACVDHMTTKVSSGDKNNPWNVTA